MTYNSFIDKIYYKNKKMRLPMKRSSHKNVTFFTFLTSSATLLCCTLPAFIALIAGGASVVALFSTFPFLITISQYKLWIFLAAGLMLTLNGYLLYRPEKACPIDSKDYCEPVTKGAKIIFWVSVGLVVTGLLFAYVIPWIMMTFL